MFLTITNNKKEDSNLVISFLINLFICMKLFMLLQLDLNNSTYNIYYLFSNYCIHYATGHSNFIL